MKVLHGVYALQALPVLEPYQLFHLGSKRLLHIRLDLLLGLFCTKAGDGIIVELELCPYDEVDDGGIDAVWPVVIEDFDVL
jgi:hypothetical protein